MVMEQLGNYSTAAFNVDRRTTSARLGPAAVLVISVGSVFNTAEKMNLNITAGSNNRPSVIMVFLRQYVSQLRPNIYETTVKLTTALHKQSTAMIPVVISQFVVAIIRFLLTKVP